MKKLLIISILILFPLLVFAQTFESNLYFGLRNNQDVEKLQEFLTDQGVYSGPITGNFFSLTLAAVKKFQSQNNISPAAGFFGPLTRAKVNDMLASQINASNQQAVAETGTAAPTATQNPTTDNNQQLIQNLQAQILAFQQQLAQMQQQNQNIQNQQTQIQSQQTQIQQNQQNQITTIQQQIIPPTPVPIPAPTPTPVVIKPAYAREAWQMYKIASAPNHPQEYPIEWQIVTDLTVPLNISGRAHGLTWEFYLNGELLSVQKNTREEHLGGMGLFERRPVLKPETTYTYKIVAKEKGREDSIYEDTFTTGNQEFMGKFNY